MTALIAALPHRGLVALSGSEAVAFLNDLITADVAELPQGLVRQAALLTPQGRILFDFLVSRTGDDLLLELDRICIDDFMKKMRLYRLRRAVDIRLDERGVYAVFNLPDPKNLNYIKDSRFPNNVWRFYGTRDDANSDAGAVQALRYAQGIAEGIADLPPQKALPLEARLDLNQGVSFDKGCYIGQEVTARTRYRGLVKRCYIPVRLAAWVETPADIDFAGKNGGILLNITADIATEYDGGYIGLASLRLAAISQSTTAGGALTVGGHALTQIFPDRLLPLPAAKEK